VRQLRASSIASVSSIHSFAGSPAMASSGHPPDRGQPPSRSSSTDSATTAGGARRAQTPQRTHTLDIASQPRPFDVAEHGIALASRGRGEAGSFSRITQRAAEAQQPSRPLISAAGAAPPVSLRPSQRANLGSSSPSQRSRGPQVSFWK
jgi:hypothetical protein